MFFVLSKTVATLLLPLDFLVFIAVIGLLLTTTRFRRAGRRLALTALILLIVLSLFPVGYDLGHALESRFPGWDASRGAPDGIVVLGGGLLPNLSAARGEPVLNSDGGRFVALAKLARDYPKARIVFSGGNGSLNTDNPAEADFVPALLDELGVDRSRVVYEATSRNTAENAALSKQVAQPKPGERWLLVTSAQHMPRAVGCFRRAGFPVEAYPAVWRTGLGYFYGPDPDIGSNLLRFDSASREWIGLAVYWLTGRTSELLPAP